MLDLENLPNPECFKLQDHPGIKPDAITEMFNAGRLDWLLSFFDFQARAKSRAEMLALVYFRQMETLKRLLDEARGINAPNVVPIARAQRGGGARQKEPTPAPEDLGEDL